MNGVLQIFGLVGGHVGPEDRPSTRKGATRARSAPHPEQFDYANSSHGARRLDRSAARCIRGLPDAIDLHAPPRPRKSSSARAWTSPPRGIAGPRRRGESFEIVNNLVSNELKFTRAGFVELGPPRASPAPQLPKASLHIRVRDSGPGIARDEERSSSPFFRSGRRGTGPPVESAWACRSSRSWWPALRRDRLEERARKRGHLYRVVAGRVHGHGPALSVPGPDFHRPIRSHPPRDSRRRRYAGRRLLLVDDNDLNALLASRLLRPWVSKSPSPRTAPSPSTPAL